jgi:UPF0176 protein
MFLNVAAYRFVDLDGLPERRLRLRALGDRLGIRGTILLAPEGINLFLSAQAEALREFLGELAADPAFEGLSPRESWSRDIAFARFLVRLKREIITFRRPGLRPAAGRAATVSPADLRRWLDAGHDDDGKPVVMVDTRNRFEVEVGSFRGALDLGLHSFTDLPAALAQRRDELAGRRVVTFCTGGIRCEKAALAMAEDGFDDVVQLDGGVLGWFEAQGAAHWDGELFVFDRRVAITPSLQEGSWRQDWPGRDVIRQDEGLRQVAPRHGGGQQGGLRQDVTAA